MTAEEELSAGVVAFLREDGAASPRADDEAVRAVAADVPPDVLLARVRGVVRECLDVPVDWTSTSLGDAGRAAAAATARRHPGLDDEALEALAWNFGFTWR